MREFFRFYFFKVLIGLIALQLVIFFWLQHRNHRPLAVNDEINVFIGHSVKLQPLRNDSDKDNDEIILQEVSSPLQGRIERKDDLLIYSTMKDFIGIDSFTYTISDGKKESRKAYIKVMVTENLRPIAKNDNAQLYPGSKIPLKVLGNDEDREGDSIFISEFSNPLYGQLQQLGDVLFYTINNKSAKKDSFQYIISDGFNLSEKATVTIIVKDKNDQIYPWLSADVGNPSIQGSLVRKNKDFIIKGSGNDIWNNEDNFHFVYQILDGDCEMVTKINSIENTDQWAKGGIMIRESLYGPSKNVYICLSSENGVNFQLRLNTGAGSTSENQRDGIKAPYWIKLVRKGNHFTGYRAPDGIQWTEVKSDSIALPKIVYIGLAVTSHNDKALCAVYFDMGKTLVKKKQE